MTPPIRTAEPGDWRAVVAALATAFGSDPVWSWLLPWPTRPRRLHGFFTIEARHVALAHGASLLTDGAAALVLPPGAWRTPLRVQALHGPAFLRVFRRCTPHALALLTAMERRHPRGPHLYLAYIGAAQPGRGIGGALLERLTARADAEDLPLYLEASSPDSARLYARHGFTGDEELRVLGSPPMLPMWRAPRR